MAKDNKKAPTGIIISILVLVMVLAIVLIVLYSICIKHFVPKELTFKEDVVISVNCDCKCADDCKCTENGPCKCADCFKCEKDEKYIIVTNPTAPNITAIICISAAFIVLLICLTVIAVKLICYCKNADDKSHEEKKQKKWKSGMA